MIELRTKFDYQIRYAMIRMDDDPNDMGLSLDIMPAFAGYNPHVQDDCVVMDLYCLDDILTMQTPQEMYLLTCECGVALDVGIMSPARVAVSSSEIFVDFEVNDYKDILLNEYTEKEGEVLRIIFDKQQYKAKLLTLMQTLKLLYKEGGLVSTLTARNFTRSYNSWQILQRLKQQYPSLQRFVLDGINPHDATIEDFIMQYPCS